MDYKRKVFMKYLQIILIYNNSMKDKEIRVLEKGNVIWGTVIENPENKNKIDYRNIIVNTNEYEIKCSFKYELIEHDSFLLTDEQRKYDVKYNVINKGNLFYSLSGNKLNPKKILITFPGLMYDYGIDNILIYYNEIFENISDEILMKFKYFYGITVWNGILLNFKANLIDKENRISYFYRTRGYNIIKINHMRNEKIFINIKGIIYSIEEFKHTSFEQKMFNLYFYSTSKFYINNDINDIEYISIDNEKFDLRSQHIYYPPSVKGKPKIIFMDRIDKSGDNAEVLYEYMKNKKINAEIYFVIDFKADDYIRLRKKSFNLINYYSKEFKELYLKSNVIISSHADMYIINNDRNRDIQYNQFFVFLQHGQIIDDMSKWLYDKKIDLFITTGKDESDKIRRFFSYEVKQYGMPRLTRQINSIANNILFAPGWSSHLNKLSYDELIKTDKFKYIEDFLSSKKLNMYLENKKIKLYREIFRIIYLELY